MRFLGVWRWKAAVTLQWRHSFQQGRVRVKLASRGSSNCDTWVWSGVEYPVLEVGVGLSFVELLCHAWSIASGPETVRTT